MRVPAAGKPRNNMDQISIATVNIKFDGNSDKPVPIPTSGVIPPGKREKDTGPWDQLPWAERRSRMVDALLGQGDLHIAGFQEVLHNQLLDIAQLLGPRFSHIGVGRDDGKDAGEYSPIYYDNTVFDVVRWKTVWLSDTPDVPGSKGWDAGLPRVATLLFLRIRATGEHIGVVNTHYDLTTKSQAGSSLLLRGVIHDWILETEKEHLSSDSDPTPVIFMGDINSETHEDGYKNMVSTHPLPHGKASFSFLDSYHQLPLRSKKDPNRQSAPAGPIHTFCDFAPPLSTDVSKRIDFIMFARKDQHSDEPRGKWRVEKYACQDNFVDGDETGWVGRWSDHRAVRVVIHRGN